MAEAIFSLDVQDFVQRLDQAAEAHMEWTRRVLRCAVLGTSPGEDVLAEDAHCRCRFGKWFRSSREHFDALNANAARRLDEDHREMHDAVRIICTHVMAGQPGDAAALDRFEQTQAGVIAQLAVLKTDCLARSARLDALTGLPLRYGLEEEFARYRAQATRRGESVVVALFDVDHFKRINDTHGHAGGDLALQHVAGVLRQHGRAGEPLFRFGGEEFLSLLQVSDRASAQQAVARLLQALRDAPLRLPDGNLLHLRMSAGLAASGPEEFMAQVIGRADRALYAAKEAGRDSFQWAADAA